MLQKIVKNPFLGFTLSELLIALAVLGVIATFTIPKVLQSQANGKYKATAKEAAAAVSEAYQNYKLKNTVDANTGAMSILPYFNYVKYDTGSNIDDIAGATTQPCDSTSPCLRLHNGGALRFDPWDYFDGTASTNATFFLFDPDGTTDGTVNSPAKSIRFVLYPNGRIDTHGTCFTGLAAHGIASGSGFCPTPSADPSWFSWN